MAGTILVKPGETVTVMGIPPDAPLPPYIPGPVDPGYSPPWAQIRPPVDPGYSPPWAQVPGGGQGGGPVDPGYSPPWAQVRPPVDPGYSPPWAQIPVDPPTEPPPVKPPETGNWVWAWSPQQGRWVWVKVPGEGEAGPKTWGAMQIICDIRTDTDEGRYLVSCARIRDVTVTHLVKKVIDVVVQDQLVGAVLDDDSRRRRRDDRYVQKFREVD